MSKILIVVILLVAATFTVYTTNQKNKAEAAFFQNVALANDDVLKANIAAFEKKLGDLKSVNEEIAGLYIDIDLDIFDYGFLSKNDVVTQVYIGGPADNAGMRVGSKIIYQTFCGRKDEYLRIVVVDPENQLKLFVLKTGSWINKDQIKLLRQMREAKNDSPAGAYVGLLFFPLMDNYHDLMDNYHEVRSVAVSNSSNLSNVLANIADVERQIQDAESIKLRAAKDFEKFNRAFNALKTKGKNYGGCCTKCQKF